MINKLSVNSLGVHYRGVERVFLAMKMTRTGSELVEFIHPGICMDGIHVDTGIDCRYLRDQR